MKIWSCFSLTSGKGQEGPWLGQISRPPSTDTFKLRIRQGVTRAAEVFRFSATHCAKLLVSQANLGRAEEHTGAVSMSLKKKLSIVRTDQDQDCTDDLHPPTIFTKAEMKTRIMLNTPTRVLLVRD